MENLKTKKRKRMSDMNESVVGKKKRVKLSESANESEAMHMEDLSADQELTEPEPVKVKAKKIKKDGAKKKKKVAMKREKKALKLAKKKGALKASAENLDSSNGENKKNAPKKKKKKAKKQKPVEVMQQKEDMATSVSKLQEKMEPKRQRKIEKKLAKQQQQSENEVEVPSVETEKAEKKIKKKEQKIVEPEPVVFKEKVKKAKREEKPEPVVVEETVVEVPKKLKKRSLDLNNEIEPVKDPELKKKKKNKVEEVVEVPEKKKSKKRKLSETKHTGSITKMNKQFTSSLLEGLQTLRILQETLSTQIIDIVSEWTKSTVETSDTDADSDSDSDGVIIQEMRAFLLKEKKENKRIRAQLLEKVNQQSASIENFCGEQKNKIEQHSREFTSLSLKNEKKFEEFKREIQEALETDSDSDNIKVSSEQNSLVLGEKIGCLMNVEDWQAEMCAKLSENLLSAADVAPHHLNQE